MDGFMSCGLLLSVCGVYVPLTLGYGFCVCGWMGALW